MQRTPEEIRAWFYRAKARIAAREEEIRAMYAEELRMKEEAEKKSLPFLTKKQGCLIL
jgi:hypothetical protein